MDKQRIKAEINYQMSILLAQKLFDEGAISKSEFNKIDQLLIEKYNPYLGRLTSPNA